MSERVRVKEEECFGFEKVAKLLRVVSGGLTSRNIWSALISL